MVSISNYKYYNNNGIHNSKTHTCCPICGSDVFAGELFCEICGMRIHSHQSHKSISKANLRSRYIFYLERDYENAKEAIYYGNRSIYNKLEWYGSWSNINGHDYVWRVDLYDNLTQEELEYAVGHIREHNGLYYKD